MSPFNGPLTRDQAYKLRIKSFKILFKSVIRSAENLILGGRLDGLALLSLEHRGLGCFLLTPGSDGGCGGVASRARLLSPAVFMEPSLVCFSARFWDALPPALAGGVSFLPDDIRDGLVPVEALVPGEGVEAVPVAGVPPGEALGFLEVPVMALVPGEGEVAGEVVAPGEALANCFLPSGVRRRRSSSASSRAGFGLVMK